MSNFARQTGIVKEVAQMVRDYIFQTTLKKAPEARIHEMLQNVKCNKPVKVFRSGKDFGYFDLLDLLDMTGIDLGLTIRLTGGEEVTFYPGHNFGETGLGLGTPQEKKAAKKPFESPHCGPHTPHWQNQGGAAVRRFYDEAIGGSPGLDLDDPEDDAGDDIIGPKALPSTSTEETPTVELSELVDARTTTVPRDRPRIVRGVE
jgi:hypothetical protein